MHFFVCMCVSMGEGASSSSGLKQQFCSINTLDLFLSELV